ncbi:4Fe-4S binding protein [bacterium]|nr:4Fe-4S binding protein [bacterium]MBU4509858.1 4Fe-4S binding protein [bacterium]
MHKMKKIGIFLCSCGDTISQTVNYKKMIKHFNSFNEISVIEKIDFMCKPKNLIELRKKIKDSRLEGVIVAACSPQLKGTIFRKAIEEAGINFNLLSLVNLREQCAMVYKEKNCATAYAIDLIEGNIRRLKLSQPILSETTKVNQSTLIIGGGFSGLQTAINLSNLGCKTILLEREISLGGSRNQSLQFVDNKTEFSLMDLIDKNIKKVNSNPLLQVFTQSELISLEGEPGNFKAIIEVKSKNKKKVRKNLNIGAVVLATGCQNYFPTEKYGIELSSQVITLSQLEKLLNCKEDLKNVNTVCFINGIVNDDQRLKGGKLLLQALGLINKYQIQVYILCKNVYVAENGLEELYQQAREKGIVFLKYEDKKPEILLGKDDEKIKVLFTDELLLKDNVHYKEGEIIIPCDLLVLEEEIIPASGADELSEMLQINCDDEGFYQQRNISLQPIFTNRKGIYTVGSCGGLKNINRTLDDCAMVSLEVHDLLKEKVIKYNLDRAVVDNDKCTLCLTCMRVCPHKAIQLENDAEPNQIKIAVNPLACESCGICVSCCPASAISLPGYENEQVTSEIAD